MINRQIILKKVEVHNLKSIDLTLPKNEFIVFSGVSGSGKSSMAFDTLYAEGQRRYVESLSTYARRQMGELRKPELESAEGLTPTISIEQKSCSQNPRSTVGTLTEVYDYLRILFARAGVPHCPISGEVVTPQSREAIADIVKKTYKNQKVQILAPFAKDKKGAFKEQFKDLLRKGFTRARVDGQILALDEEVSLDRNVTHTIEVVIDRLKVSETSEGRLMEALFSAMEQSDGDCLVLGEYEENFFSSKGYAPSSGESYSALQPQDFSFNSPSGMCSDCQGLGTVFSFDLDLVIDEEKSIAEDCCLIASSYETVRFGNIYRNLADLYDFSVDTPWKDLPSSAKKVFLHGTEKKWTRMRFIHPEKGTTWGDYVRWQGVLYEAKKRYADATSDVYKKNMEKLMDRQECPSCEGSRLKKFPSVCTFHGKTIHALSQLSISACLSFFTHLELSESEKVICSDLLKEICQRLDYLVNVGLEYLTLDRTAPSLSGGEAQRVRLASQIGCGLVNVTYILDEPSIGLHYRDNQKLIQTLQTLKDRGNTVIVVEHDEDTIWAADHVVDFGPKAGEHGGCIVHQGSVKQLLKKKNSLTGLYLSGKKELSVPKKTRKGQKEYLCLEGVSHNNLKNLSVKFPLGKFLAITGVSGSGKSSLIMDVLYPSLATLVNQADLKVGKHKALRGYEHVDKVIAVDQSPIGKTPRSNPATYIKVFDLIRNLYAQLPESQARGYKVGRFSFNVAEGSCSHCSGVGMTKVDMDFLADAWVPCSVCQMQRFDAATLEVHFKEKNIFDVLELTVEEALIFFENQPQIRRKLETLDRVGLSYLKLGQPSPTLSGGEAQRVKLAKELSRSSKQHTVYILDEPTTGLHFEDIQHLLRILHSFVDAGHTVIVIEHNTDIIKNADWVIDLGPDGGESGGSLVAEGVPTKLAKMDTPTGLALKASYAKKVQDTTKARKVRKEAKCISVESAREHNLKNISVEIPHKQITICTGPSGSGKTSFAFDTLYAEGQRRYVESLSPYARQFVKQMPKPRVGKVEGLSPAVAIEQKAHAGNPRSTVGTLTDVYDYLRILYARKGVPHCPKTGEEIKAISKEHVVERLLCLPEGEKCVLLAPLELKRSDSFDLMKQRFLQQGFLRVRVNGEIHELDGDISLDKKRKNTVELVVDRIKLHPTQRFRIFEGVENASKIGHEQLLVLREDGSTLFYNLKFAVESTGEAYPEITPQSFSFNTKSGMCFDCQGLGVQYGSNLDQYKSLQKESLLSFLSLLWGEEESFLSWQLIEHVCEEESIDLDTLICDLPPLIMQGSDKWYMLSTGFYFQWKGINPTFAKFGKSASSERKRAVQSLLDEYPCSSCEGTRLQPLARYVTVDNVSMGELCQKPLQEVFSFINSLSWSAGEEKLLAEVKRQLLARLRFLNDVGLGYLSLHRTAPSLSGGEAQRIHLAKQLGSALTGVLYILDEPTIGLHPYDNERLNKALLKLKDLGNTLLMVEHDPLTIQHADYLLDFGPHGGQEGGYLSAKGSLPQLKKNKKSLTGAFLSHKRTISPVTQRRLGKKSIEIRNASLHNLKNLSLSIPLHTFTCLSGVSGSGKSTLLKDVLFKAFERGVSNCVQLGYAEVEGIEEIAQCVYVNQNPIGTTNRALICTYTDALAPLRSFFSSLPEARTRGLQPKHFSFNHRKGMCTHCWGLGYRKVEMHFLPPLKVTCEYCNGLRLNPLSLEVRYKGKNLGQHLKSTVAEARETFEAFPKLQRILQTLMDVGLGYLALDQQIATLSGGEAQRLKLSRELKGRKKKNVLYLLDEPTTGLHPVDIELLLGIFHQLVDQGNTIICIEHNTDFLAHADYLFELGPGAGDKGGHVIVKGTPEEVICNRSSVTGKYLSDCIQK